MNKNTMPELKKWAALKCAELEDTIRNYMDNGIDHATACEMALSGSILGSGHHAQIKYDTKHYIPKITKED